MLTKTDVLAYWYKQRKFAIPLVNQSPNTIDHKSSFIVCGFHNRLIALCSHPHAAASITGFNSQPGISFYAKRMNNMYPEFTFDTDKSWLLQLSTNKAEWNVSYDFESIDELEQVILTSNKAAALDHVFNRVDENRVLFLNDVDACQGRIYQSKVQEAKEIIDKNIDTDDLLKYPFVSGYARTEEISIQEASKHILIKNTIQEAGLAESENLRIRSKKAIMQATSMKELSEVFNRFDTELAKYGDL